MTRTIASMTAVAVLYAFTSALAQAPESVPAPTDSPAASAPQDTSPSPVPAPSMGVPKVEEIKRMHGKMKKVHRERGKSREHRKDGEHKRHGKHRDKHEDGDKHEELTDNVARVIRNKAIGPYGPVAFVRKGKEVCAESISMRRTPKVKVRIVPFSRFTFTCVSRGDGGERRCRVTGWAGISVGSGGSTRFVTRSRSP